MAYTYVHGNLDGGGAVAAEEGDFQDGVFSSWLLQVELHKTVMH